MTAITGQLDHFLLGLTPLERLDAIQKYHNDPSSHQWFVFIGLSIIAILAILLVISMYRRKKNTRNASGGLFDEYADAKGLTDREYRMLMNIAVCASLKRNEFIFTLPSAFDRQAAAMIEETLAKKGIEESRKLQTELDGLRDKLDFRYYHSPDMVEMTETETQSSRQIPLKKKIHIKRNHRTSNGDLEAMVINNSPEGLTLQLKAPVEIVFGQPWVCRYYSGRFVAEFNTTVLKCSGQIVMLQHNDHIRLVNRRKFLRVPTKQPAYVARFPFTKEAAADTALSRTKNGGAGRDAAGPEENAFQAPHFVPAIVTELGGPGLRITTTLPVNVGDRVLLMFKLDQHISSSAARSGNEKIIEHIAQVRHITNDENGASVALELVGLNDEGIDELIRATNEASIMLNKWRNSYQQMHSRNKQAEPLVSV